MHRVWRKAGPGVYGKLRAGKDEGRSGLRARRQSARVRPWKREDIDGLGRMVHSRGVCGPHGPALVGYRIVRGEGVDHDEGVAAGGAYALEVLQLGVAWSLLKMAKGQLHEYVKAGGAQAAAIMEALARAEGPGKQEKAAMDQAREIGKEVPFGKSAKSRQRL